MKDLKLIAAITIVSLLAFIFETTVVSFPIIFFMGALALAFQKKIYIYIMVFISAFIIDTLRVSNFSYTPIFLLITIAIIMLYERYSGSKDALIAILIIGMMGFFYTQLLSYSLLLTITFYVLSIAIFGILNFLKSRNIIYI